MKVGISERMVMYCHKGGRNTVLGGSIDCDPKCVLTS